MNHARPLRTAASPLCGFHRRRADPWPRRSGVALVLVLLVICITLGLSYAAVRSQFVGLKIQQNADRRTAARQAAVTGLTMAIKKMHTSDWDGVDTTLSGSLGDFQSFQVTYTTGDPSLTSEHPDYEDLPYRVTLLASGYAADPDNPASVATHQIRAVVRLIPRALADEPANWTEMVQYTLYQTQAEAFTIDVPFRIEGPVRVQDTLTLGRTYAWSDDARGQYLTDLEQMRQGGYADWRPLNGPIYWTDNLQEPGMESLLDDEMGIPTNDVSQDPVSGWNHPGEVSTYQIYPGGKVYDVPVLAQDHQDEILEPDPETNPLGIYYRPGELRLYDNVTIRGTLVSAGSSNGDVHLYGTNVHLLPHDLPPLEGTDVPVQLPLVVAEDDFRIHPGAEGSVRGLLTVWDEFEVREDGQYDIDVTMQTRIVAEKFLLRRRSDWNYWAVWWTDRYYQFKGQEGNQGGIAYFPVWLQAWWGLDPDPRLTVQPDPVTTRYHRYSSCNPVYVPHPDDDGLRWDLLEWTENP